ncbi:GntR family transcriptional regulator [Streptomyces sp. CLV115]|uniref:GntR family transcriptional regulator n=1 Tax=Streptomyces sp. CLV115 TaxID=3138502 RepID=UPI00313B1D03
MTTGKGVARSAAEVIAEDLRARLLRLDLYPGSPLRETELSERYGASRHTVRSAIALLESEGILVHDRNRGARVREFTAPDIDDAFDLREALELEAVRLICRRSPPLDGVVAAVDHLDRLEEIERREPSERATHETLQADRQVHRAFVEATANPRLLHAYDTIATEIAYCYVLCRVTSMTPDDREHRAILNALFVSDEVTALDLLASHIEAARRQCVSAVRPPAEIR